ncbi:solute carrier family 39 (zinc transporter), member 1/2/3 [Nematocida sp. LUAm3]|nr:solute carrier family 39 (zinc transporter), member 1/2/3 [Nematocida sp. LUAm3]KAI5175910.1 solute carrier family 39 (zinc transporter), member 1/2/3 [Nematocida sp. LUAm2]KAI5178708.1 solute carrier family 39 (zinc transporter), member 1/2/3 [Nematocida sp. LUAm1]
MDSTILLNLSAVFLFVFTLLFTYSYKFIKSMMKVYDYIKCLTGGFIIGIILMEVLPDIYKVDSMLPAVTTGLSFFFLFILSKLYIERANIGEQDAIPQGASKKEALIFILALSLHSFMEGLGISNKQKDKLIWYLVSILLHKWLEAIILGTSVLTSSLTDTVSFILLVVYSSLTSIGALMGNYLASKGNPNIRHILDGIAAGSFFYIGFVEMVGNEFETSSGKLTRRKALLKIGSMLIGYLLITGLLLMAKHIENFYDL